MVQTVLQLVLVVALASLAWMMRRSLRRERERSWSEIATSLRDDDLLPNLTYCPGVSEDLSCDEQELIKLVEHPRALWIIYRQSSAILEAVERLKSIDQHSRCLTQRLVDVQRAASKSQFRVLQVVVYRCSFVKPKSELEPIKEMARHYVAAMAHLGMTLNDFDPKLARHFPYWIANHAYSV